MKSIIEIGVAAVCLIIFLVLLVDLPDVPAEARGRYIAGLAALPLGVILIFIRARFSTRRKKI